MTPANTMGTSRPRRPFLTGERRHAMWGILFALPAVVFFIAMFAYPLGYTFYLSFHTWDLLSPPVWVGLDNYTFLLNYSEFQNSILKTCYYVVGVSVPIIILSIVLAAFFNQKFRFRQLSLTIFYIPVGVGLSW